VLRAYSGALGVALLVGSLAFVLGGGGFGVTNWFICMRFEVDIHSRLDGYWDSFPIQNSVFCPPVKITNILCNNLKLKPLYTV